MPARGPGRKSSPPQSGHLPVCSAAVKVSSVTAAAPGCSSDFDFVCGGEAGEAFSCGTFRLDVGVADLVPLAVLAHAGRKDGDGLVGAVADDGGDTLLAAPLHVGAQRRVARSEERRVGKGWG